MACDNHSLGSKPIGQKNYNGPKACHALTFKLDLSRVASQSEIDADDSWSGVQFDCDPSGCTREVMGSHTC